MFNRIPAILLAPVIAVAQPAVAEARLADLLCPMIIEIAENAMKGHQGGTPMTAMLEVAQEARKSDAAVGQLVEDIILAAYEKPRYRTAEAKLREVEIFRDEAAVACWKNLD
mgnify:CR=1 FL=1